MASSTCEPATSVLTCGSRDGSGHCLYGVDDQIQDYLLQLDRVSGNTRQVLAGIFVQDNVTLPDGRSDVYMPLTHGPCPHTRLNVFEMKRQERSRHIKKMF